MIFNKTKLITLTLVGILVGSGLVVYQKFFGGEVEIIPQGKFLVGELPEESMLKQEEKVAVAYAEIPAEGVREVLSRTGNLDFIKPGEKVLIKPNINSDVPAPGTTHPEALAEVVRFVKAKGAYVIVGDRSNARWETVSAMKKTGMYQAAQEAGADEIVGFEEDEWERVKPERASNWLKGFRVPKLLAEIDHVISVPVLHTHFLTSHSLALKNLVGLIHPDDRAIMHASPKRDEMITEISLTVKPSLTVIEGTKAFVDGGPFEGTISEPKVYLASKDILAAEVAGVELLKKHGANLFWDSPWESRLVKRATELGLGEK